MHAQSRRFRDGAREGAGAALAVGPRHMQHRRQPVLRIAELAEQRDQPVEAEVDQPRMQPVQPLQDALDARHVRPSTPLPSSWPGQGRP
jgi:hypothetical protein